MKGLGSSESLLFPAKHMLIRGNLSVCAQMMPAIIAVAASIPTYVDTDNRHEVYTSSGGEKRPDTLSAHMMS